jgi:signal transduction histidine kinase
MCCYAGLSGLVPSEAMIPLVNVQVILLRGVCAFGIMFFTIRGMSVFSLEQRELVNDRLQRFSQSEKLASMGILAAGIAHEINNPLTNVSLNVEMLKDIVGSHEKGQKKIEAIERNLDRATRIAKELLHFSREKETTLEPVDINVVIQGVLTLVRSQPRSSIIRLELQDVPLISGIAWKLEEAFLNILMNSFDACTEDDYVEVKTFSKDRNVIVEVTDSGKGIQSKHLSKIFDPFFTTKDVGKGTGLGLSVCYNIIKQHGGDISIISSDHGGTVVTVAFLEIEDGR